MTLISYSKSEEGNPFVGLQLLDEGRDPSSIVMGVFNLFSDESGDLGIDFSSRGTTRLYVPFLLFLRKKYQDIFYNLLKAQFKKHANITVTKWNRLPGKIKNSDTVLSNIIGDFYRKVRQEETNKSEIIFLMSVAILDKKEISKSITPKLYSSRIYRMAWPYGLSFKRLGFYLSKTNDIVTWIIDQNASPEIANLKKYINDYIPEHRNFLKRYSGPRFCKPAEKSLMKATDFFVGLSRVITENILSTCFGHPDCQKKAGGCFLKCRRLSYPATIRAMLELLNRKSQ